MPPSYCDGRDFCVLIRLLVLENGSNIRGSVLQFKFSHSRREKCFVQMTRVVSNKGERAYRPCVCCFLWCSEKAYFLYFGLMMSLLAGVAHAQEVLLSEGRTLNEIRASIPNITTVELKAELDNNPNLYIIDVRTVRETNILGGFIKAKRSMIIPRGWLEFRISDAVKDKNSPIVVYCGTNQRSPLALLTLKRMGYTNVHNYAEGFPAWEKAGYPITTRDAAYDSFLYSKPQKVMDGVYSAIGETSPSTYENSGHNNNLSFVVTREGVVVFNAGGSWLLAKALHDEIGKVTDQPVKFLVLENGQGHAALGASYWREQGVHIIAHEDAAHELKEHGAAILTSAKRRLGDKFYGTYLVEPDETFAKKRSIELGGIHMEALNLGPAHSPGDIMLWLPQKKLVISGDTAFHERLLPVFEDTQTSEWIKTWDSFEALGAEIVIPGHGRPTNMVEVTKYTKEYLVYMRNEIGAIIENGGELVDAYKVDQSAYEHLDTFEFLAMRNAARIFQAMEFE